jgi:hypothetical protein
MASQRNAFVKWSAIALMLVAEGWTLFLVFSWRVCGWVGGDRWLLLWLELPWQPGSWFWFQTKTVTPSSAKSLS